jgi:hypothetical protein
VRGFVIPDSKKRTSHPRVRENIQDGAAVYTDDFPAYMGLEGDSAHAVIDHAERYVDGRVHTNGVENFWSLLKRGPHGTYVSVEPFHLFRYVDEQAWGFNNRKSDQGRDLDDAERFKRAATRIVGKRLTFAEATGKVGETSPN